MKKITLLLIMCALLLPASRAHASLFSDFISWLIPSPLKPDVVEITQRGAGGILISASPIVVTGDTLETFFLPALARRSFSLENQGPIDLYLNTFSPLRYSASPSTAVGDTPTSFALNVGSVRAITIQNPSTTTDFFLSKRDLSIDSSAVSGTTTSQGVFLEKTSAQAGLLEGVSGVSPIASFTFSFVFNNATNRDIYISREINSKNFLTLTPLSRASTTIKFIEANVSYEVGDTPLVYVIPAGTSRNFEVTGIVDNTFGIAGVKNISIAALYYSNSPDLSPLLSFTSPTQLRGLSVGVHLGVGKLPNEPIQNEPIVASTTEATSVKDTPVTPTPLVSPSPSSVASPKPTATVPPLWVPRPTPSSTPTPTPSQTPAASKTPYPSLTPSTKPTPSYSPSSSPTYSPGPSVSPVITSTPTASPNVSISPSVSPSIPPSPTPSSTSAISSPAVSSSPTPIATPSSSSVTPTSSPVGYDNAKKGKMAAALYSLGEFLDYIFLR